MIVHIEIKKIHTKTKIIKVENISEWHQYQTTKGKRFIYGRLATNNRIRRASSSKYANTIRKYTAKVQTGFSKLHEFKSNNVLQRKGRK